MNYSDLDKMLREYYKGLSASESMTKVIKNAFKNIKTLNNDMFSQMTENTEMLI